MRTGGLKLETGGLGIRTGGLCLCQLGHVGRKSVLACLTGGLALTYKPELGCRARANILSTWLKDPLPSRPVRWAVVCATSHRRVYRLGV